MTKRNFRTQWVLKKCARLVPWELPPSSIAPSYPSLSPSLLLPTLSLVVSGLPSDTFRNYARHKLWPPVSLPCLALLCLLVRPYDAGLLILIKIMPFYAPLCESSSDYAITQRPSAGQGQEQPRFSHNELSQFLFHSLIPSFPNRVLD